MPSSARGWSFSAGRGPGRHRPQDRPDLAGDADRLADHRARLRPLLDDMLFATGAEIEAGRFLVPRFEVEFAFILARPLKGPGVTAVRRAQRDRLRHAGARADRRPHRAVRPRDEGAAQGARHDRRQRRQRRHRPRRPADAAATPSTGAGPARCSTRTASSRSRAWPPPCSTTRATAWPGWPTSSRRTTSSSSAGEIVLGGSFTRPVACAAGDVFHADYGPLGSISLRFV